jgi:hypothetical protein
MFVCLHVTTRDRFLWKLTIRGLTKIFVCITVSVKIGQQLRTPYMHICTRFYTRKLPWRTAWDILIITLTPWPRKCRLTQTTVMSLAPFEKVRAHACVDEANSIALQIKLHIRESLKAITKRTGQNLYAVRTFLTCFLFPFCFFPSSRFKFYCLSVLPAFYLHRSFFVSLSVSGSYTYQYGFCDCVSYLRGSTLWISIKVSVTLRFIVICP